MRVPGPHQACLHLPATRPCATLLPGGMHTPTKQTQEQTQHTRIHIPYTPYGTQCMHARRCAPSGSCIAGHQHSRAAPCVGGLNTAQAPTCKIASGTPCKSAEPRPSRAACSGCPAGASGSGEPCCWDDFCRLSMLQRTKDCPRLEGGLVHGAWTGG